MIPNGSPINLGTNLSANISLRYFFVKPDGASLSIRSAIGTKAVSNRFLFSYEDTVPTVGTGINRGFNFEVYDTDTDNNGSGYIDLRAQCTSCSTNLYWDSNKIYITKAPPVPTFTASPSTLTLACGDVSSKTFTVIPANIPSGASVTYQWNIGTGWSGQPSNQNSITLTPLYPTSLPSSVSVTPYINGVAKSTVYFNVIRGNVANGSISGNPVVCSSSSFSYIGLLPGQTVTWSLSNNTAGILTTTSGTSTIFTLVNLVSVNLIATVLNTCGTTFTKSVSIISGGPQMSGTVYGPTCVAFGQRVTYYYIGKASNGSTYYNWGVDAPIDDSGPFGSPTNCTWKNLSQPSTGSAVVSFKAGCIPTIAVVRVSVNTPCVNANYAYLYIEVNEFGICSNFRNSITNINEDNGKYASFEFNDENSTLLTKVDDSNKYLASIYDISGLKVKEFTSNDYDVSDLKTGIYILKLNVNDKITTSKFFVK